MILKTEPADPRFNREPGTIGSNKNAQTSKNQELEANSVLPPIRFLKPRL